MSNKDEDPGKERRLGDGAGGEGVLDKADRLSKWLRGETQPRELCRAQRVTGGEAAGALPGPPGAENLLCRQWGSLNVQMDRDCSVLGLNRRC